MNIDEINHQIFYTLIKKNLPIKLNKMDANPRLKPKNVNGMHFAN